MGSKDDDVAQMLLNVTRMLMNSIAAQFRQKGPRVSPANFGILAKIREGDCTLSDLAQHLCVQLPTISRSVSLLVERGLVERWIPESNRRTAMVRLTPDGQKVLCDLMGEAKVSTKAMLHSLTKVERQTVLTGLKLLARAFSEYDGTLAQEAAPQKRRTRTSAP